MLYKGDDFIMRRPLVVSLLTLTILTLSVCCLSAALAQSLLFPQRGKGAQAASQAKNIYITLARQDASNTGISPGLFVRQIDLESGFNPRALSPAGAEGIAQFLPATAASLGINPWNPADALKGAARLMARYTKLFGGNYTKALAAYNAGPGAVQRALKRCGLVRWMHCLPPETQHYVQLILQ
jgi:soluble lytic murein transglycosylase-like protein